MLIQTEMPLKCRLYFYFEHLFFRLYGKARQKWGINRINIRDGCCFNRKVGGKREENVLFDARFLSKKNETTDRK